MLNKSSILLAGVIVALSGSVANADPGGYNHQSGNNQYGPGSYQGDDRDHSAYANGYNYGYDDGYARRNRNDSYRADVYRIRGQSHGYERGAYYYGSDCNGEAAAGTVIGAVAGGVIGSQIGHGDTRTAATVGGVILGGLAGNSIARDINCRDRHYAFTSYSAGFDGRIGQRYEWRNEQGDSYGSFTPTREYSRSGYTCRDFTEVTYRKGQQFDRQGTACRQNDGNWYLE
jgi:surface antigen